MGKEAAMSKIAFVWYWERASEIMPKWRDGLTAAIEEVGKTHDVDVWLDKQVPPNDYDFILFWDDSNSAFFNELDKYQARKGICLTTDPHNMENLKKLDVVYCESDPIYERVRAQGIRAIKAFGTDTEFYSPDPSIEKDIEYFYPATFSPWKRQSEIAYLGPKLLCVGTLQPDGYKELDAVANAGCQIKRGYFDAKEIRDYYRRTKRMIIPAVHGSERTVLEAMATDILPEVTHPENVRTASYIKEFKDSGLASPREFVLNNYSHEKYAEALLKGIES